MSDIEIPTITSENQPITETHGIGDSCVEKPPSPSQSLPNLDASGGSSFNSCESFKTLCRAWKSRLASESMSKLDRNINDIEAKLEGLTSKLDVSENVSHQDFKELARTLSLCVVMESRSLELTDSSEEDTPKQKTATGEPRFFEPQEIRQAHVAFKEFDANGDNQIELAEMKMALEKLSVPQTHLASKKLMAEFAGPQSTTLTFCQFLLAYASILQENTNASQHTKGRKDLKSAKESANVSKVNDAKRFFEAKITQQTSERIIRPTKKANVTLVPRS